MDFTERRCQQLSKPGVYNRMSRRSKMYPLLSCLVLLLPMCGAAQEAATRGITQPNPAAKVKRSISAHLTYGQEFKVPWPFWFESPASNLTCKFYLVVSFNNKHVTSTSSANVSVHANNFETQNLGPFSPNNDEDLLINDFDMGAQDRTTALHVTTTSPASVSAWMTCEDTPDEATRRKMDKLRALPTYVWGYDYEVVASYGHSHCGYDVSILSASGIVKSVDIGLLLQGTGSVSVLDTVYTNSVDLVFHYGNETETSRLDIQVDDADVTGTTIKSNDKIAVFIGDFSQEDPSASNCPVRIVQAKPTLTTGSALLTTTPIILKTQRTKFCACPCRSSFLQKASHKEIMARAKDEAKAISKNLTVEKDNLSSVRRTKESAEIKESATVLMGRLLGIGMLSGVGAIIVVPDLICLLHYLRDRFMP